MKKPRATKSMRTSNRLNMSKPESAIKSLRGKNATLSGQTIKTPANPNAK